jgi:hypothetical protein
MVLSHDVKIEVAVSQAADTATMLTKCQPASTNDMDQTSDVPTTRKRKATQRLDFIQIDDFVATKKTKTKSTGKKQIEEEFATTWICVECKEAECMMEPDATELLICDGVCRRVFHYPCAGLSQLPPDDVPFICNDCSNVKHVCSLCSNYGYDNEDVFKCSKSNCGLFYHESCLSMRNVEVAVISKNMCSGIDEKIQNNNNNTDGIDVDDIIHNDNNDNNIDPTKKAYITKIELKFVCPAHSCWTCTQIDLKDQSQQQDLLDDSTLTKKTKKKKKIGCSGAFEGKKESFLTVRSW